MNLSSNEEKPVEGATPAKFVYDYFLKDHLGNVHMVVTDEGNVLTNNLNCFTGKTGEVLIELLGKIRIKSFKLL